VRFYFIYILSVDMGYVSFFILNREVTILHKNAQFASNLSKNSYDSF
jgi:hypothetical protein